MAPEDERAPQASPSPPPEPGGVSGARGDLGGGPGAGFGSGVSGGLYHERQRLELCALHALNNLLQRPWLSKAAADGICRRLAPNSRPNPHRSPLGTGNYDINVVMAALGTLGLAAVWWDKRRPLERLSVSPVLGFLLNVPSRPRLGGLRLPLARPHWLSVRHLGDSFYNLDSKLPAPASIGSETQLREFLQRVLDEGSSELFLVVPREVEEEGTWLKPE
ncbi:josephin-2-like isoform X1 [Poecile atricapillus]|uniref:josephin-2-like isoform X1 n=1 Tax=Poecile atricapillus TaxID=48891 RepID=UPI00273884C3|nr:josephin-2-like isoform X1 [Poecile atricapillus]